MSFHIMSYHAMLYYLMSCHATSCHVMLCILRILRYAVFKGNIDALIPVSSLAPLYSILYHTRAVLSLHLFHHFSLVV
jgi:hypothetical protein